MKILTAAPYTVAGIEVGYCHCDPGELVMLGVTSECDCHEDEDEGCGCHLDCGEEPPFVGLVSLLGATTARVEERDMTPEQLREAVHEGLEPAGPSGRGQPDELMRTLVDFEVERIQQITDRYEVGALISFLSGRSFPISGLARER